MSHNITTSTDRLGEVSQPTDALLTVVDRNGSPGRVLFHHGIPNNPFAQPGLTINPWARDGSKSFRFLGEDLYAFRELLNELPEEAFVRPADPVLDGSYYLRDDSPFAPDWVFLEDRGWTRFGRIAPSEVGPKSDYLHFDDWEKIVDAFGINVERVDPPKPRWTDGDIVRPDEQQAITYVRREGAWDRLSDGYVRSHHVSDTLISSLVDGHGYDVIYQANR